MPLLLLDQSPTLMITLNLTSIRPYLQMPLHGGIVYKCGPLWEVVLKLFAYVREALENPVYKRCGEH